MVRNTRSEVRAFLFLTFAAGSCFIIPFRLASFSMVLNLAKYANGVL